MKDQLDKLLAGLKGTSAAARVVAGLVACALVVLVTLAAVVANRPHYELAFSGLSDHELAGVCRALSEAGIPFEQSQPPGPFVIYVDEGQRSSAYRAAYASGALDKPLEGILAGQGVASVFESAEERAQGVRKREWQEMEKMLEELDFVEGARVRTSAVTSSLLGRTPTQTPTASVALRVAGGAELTPAQSETVANLVSRGLGIDKQHLVVSDQSGRSLFDGESRAEGREVEDLLARQADYDQRTARTANAELERILGPNKARVTVTSEWDYAQSTLRKDITAKGAVVQETKTESEKPIAGANGSTAGLSANTLDPDAPAAETPGSSGALAAVERTSEETKEYAPTVTREERVRVVPKLERLSVALFLDQSVAAQSQDLEQAVQAAVGFDSERRDGFTTIVLPFVAPPEAASATPAPEAEAATVPSRVNPLLEILLRRGVELLSAAVFLFLLLRTLRGSRKERAAAAAAPAQAGGGELDPELLARAQIDQLLKSDPGKVGELLARWVREEPATTGQRA